MFKLIGWLGLAVTLLARRTDAQTNSATTTRRLPIARVVIAQDPGATEDLVPVPEIIQLMVDRAVTNLTGQASVAAAWRSLVSTQDVVGIKVFSAPGRNSGTRPTVAAAVVQDLIAAGLPPRHIIIWDRQLVDLKLAGFAEFEQRYGIRVMGSVEAGYDLTNFYEIPLIGNMNWSDVDFGKKGPGIGRKSYVSKLVDKEITKMINIPPLLHHNVAGVSGCLYTLALASVDNTLRFENDPDSLARAVPEIYAMPIIGDRVVLNIVDALICQYEGQERGLLHYSNILNELRVSRDPVALDVLSLEEIDHQRQLAGVPLNNTNVAIYPNAALLEIGVSDMKRIRVERISPAEQ